MGGGGGGGGGRGDEALVAGPLKKVFFCGFPCIITLVNIILKEKFDFRGILDRDVQIGTESISDQFKTPDLDPIIF